MNYGTLYPALLKLEQEGYVTSEWGVSDNNRKAKFYKLTRAGRKQIGKRRARVGEDDGDPRAISRKKRGRVMRSPGRLIDELRQDVGFGLRTLIRNPSRCWDDRHHPWARHGSDNGHFQRVEQRGIAAVAVQGSRSTGRGCLDDSSHRIGAGSTGEHRIRELHVLHAVDQTLTEPIGNRAAEHDRCRSPLLFNAGRSGARRTDVPSRRFALRGRDQRTILEPSLQSRPERRRHAP